jgi:hypothetical protein
MALQDELNRIKENFAKTAPKEALEVMHNATVALQNSGIMDGIKKVGDNAPGFSLKNINDDDVTSMDLLVKGPLVLGFFRGRW